MYSPEVQTQIAQLRAKALAGQATLDDFKLAVKLIRQDRSTVGQSAGGAKSKRAPKAPVNVDALFDELDKQ